jgi:hypothetical protein
LQGNISGQPSHPAVRPLLPKQKRQLAGMGLRIKDFSAFATCFVGHLFDFIQRRPTDAHWQLIRKRPLTNALLLLHLRGRRWLGTGCRWDPTLGVKGRHASSYLILDLDYHGDWVQVGAQSAADGAVDDPAWRDLLRRYDAVVRALGTPSIVFRSSKTGGLHSYYLFTHVVELHRLRDPDGSRGAVMQLLAAEGLVETPGQVEVYPRGQYKRRGPQTRIRLPFGRGSLALDPDTMNRLTLGGPRADLCRFADRYERDAVRLTDPDDWIRCARESVAGGAAPFVAKKKSPSVARRSQGAEPRDDAAAGPGVGSLWLKGLGGPGQLNAAIWRLASDLRRRGASCTEATERLHRWLDEKHNKCSRTFNASSAGAHQEVEDVVARLFARPGVSRDWGALPGLSGWEARALIEATRHDHQIADPNTGELIGRFKLQQLGFELLRRGKQWILCELRWRMADLGDEGAEGPARSALDVAVSSFWPDTARPEFIVPVPFNLRQAIDGVGKDTQWALWRVLQHAGVFRLGRVASADAHRAATYRVALDFGAHASEEASFSSLTAALHSILTAEDVGSLYTKHYARRIRAAQCSPDVLPSVDEPASALIRRSLIAPIADSIRTAA